MNDKPSNSSPDFTPSDHHYMSLALDLAKQGADKGEVPVGAVLVQFNDINVNHEQVTEKSLQDEIQGLIEGEILGQGYNQPIDNHDPTAHAEIMALRNACQNLNNYRLPPNTTMYVTLEPCTMCVGALIHARLNRLVFATAEPRAGMVGSQGNLLEAGFYNHKQVLVQSGLMAEESSAMLKAFFKGRREQQKQLKKHKNKACLCN